MPTQILLPGVQHQREGRGAAQMARTPGELGQRGGHRLEQQFIHASRCRGDPAIHRMRQGEHQMEIRYRQHLAAPGGEPGLLGPGLAAWAMAIAAGVIDMPGGSTAVTGFDLPAQGCRTAGQMARCVDSNTCLYLPLSGDRWVSSGGGAG